MELLLLLFVYLLWRELHVFFCISSTSFEDRHDVGVEISAAAQAIVEIFDMASWLSMKQGT